VPTPSSLPQGLLLLRLVWIGAAGLGLFCGFYFCALLVWGTQVPAWLLLLAAVAAGSGSICFSARMLDPGLPTASGTAARWLIALTWATVGAALLLFVLKSMYSPHGNHDSWAMWNMRAKAVTGLDGDSEQFVAVFRDLVAGADHPFVLPLAVAGVAELLGGFGPLAPMLVAAFFSIAVGIALYAGLRLLAGASAACYAVLLLLGSKAFVDVGASQLADVPDRPLPTPQLLVLGAGATQPLEAQPSLVCGWVRGGLGEPQQERGPTLRPQLHRRDPPGGLSGRELVSRGRALRNVALGAAPVLLLLLLFKLSIAHGNESLSSGRYEQLLDPQRYWTAVRILCERALQFGNGMLTALVLVTAYFVLQSRRGDRSPLGSQQDRRNERALLRPLLLVAAVYYSGVVLAYVLSPFPVELHASWSAKRLILQFWPTLLLVLVPLAHEGAAPSCGEPGAQSFESDGCGATNGCSRSEPRRLPRSQRKSTVSPAARDHGALS
jgi:hypothetical protein